MIGYKVTDCEGFSVAKVARKNPPEESLIQYEVGKWIYPNPGMGALAVFKKKERAERFIKHFGKNFRLFECEFVKSKSTFMWDGIKKLHQSSFIERTVLADKVFLIREIV